MQKLTQLKPIILDTASEQNKEDCRAFIKNNLAENGYTEYLTSTKFINSLLEKSEANMLYLTSFFKSVKDGFLDIKYPNKFPIGLNGTYEHFFERITKDEDVYYEKYAPIFEVMIASKEYLSKQLLADILGIDRIDLKRTLNKFKTLVTEKDNRLNFYHKSIEDWLQMKTNERFEVSAEKGNKRIQLFISQINVDTYREEYTDFPYLNKSIIQYIYNKNNDLKAYFSIIANLQNAYKLKILIDIGKRNFLEGKIRIILLEEALIIAENMYQNNQEKWVHGFILVLKELSELYKKNKNTEKLLILKEKILAIPEQLFKKNRDSQIAYSNSLYNISSLPTTKRIFLLHKYLSVNGIPKDNSNSWAKAYTNNLVDLLASYKIENNTKGTIALKEKELTIIEKLYKEDPKKHSVSYFNKLNNLARLYYRTNNIFQSLDYLDKGYEELKEKCKENNFLKAELIMFIKNIILIYSNDSHYYGDNLVFSVRILGRLRKLIKELKELEETNATPIIFGAIGQENLDLTAEHYQEIVSLFYFTAKDYPNRPILLISQLSTLASIFVAQLFLWVKEEYRFDFKLIVPIPYDIDYFKRKQFKNKCELEMFNNLLAKCENTFELNKLSDTTKSSLDKSIDIELDELKEYHKIGGEFVVDTSTILIALWDGMENKIKGSTANTITYLKPRSSYNVFIMDSTFRICFRSIIYKQNEVNDLDFSCKKAGDLFVWTEQFDKALKYNKQYNKLIKKLYEENPKQINLKNGLAISYQNIGYVYKSLGNLKKTLKYYEQYNQLKKELCEENPKLVNLKNGLAISHSILGGVYETLGNLNKALQYYEQYNQLEKELYEENPKQVNLKNELAVSYSKLYEFYFKQKNCKKAKGYTQLCFTLLKELTQDFPENEKFKENFTEVSEFITKLNQECK